MPAPTLVRWCRWKLEDRRLDRVEQLFLIGPQRTSITVGLLGLLFIVTLFFAALDLGVDPAPAPAGAAPTTVPAGP
jgi:hypothetical protein